MNTGFQIIMEIEYLGNIIMQQENLIAIQKVENR